MVFGEIGVFARELREKGCLMSGAAARTGEFKENNNEKNTIIKEK